MAVPFENLDAGSRPGPVAFKAASISYRLSRMFLPGPPQKASAAETAGRQGIGRSPLSDCRRGESSSGYILGRNRVRGEALLISIPTPPRKIVGEFS